MTGDPCAGAELAPSAARRADAQETLGLPFVGEICQQARPGAQGSAFRTVAGFDAELGQLAQLRGRHHVDHSADDLCGVAGHLHFRADVPESPGHFTSRLRGSHFFNGRPKRTRRQRYSQVQRLRAARHPRPCLPKLLFELLQVRAQQLRSPLRTARFLELFLQIGNIFTDAGQLRQQLCPYADLKSDCRYQREEQARQRDAYAPAPLPRFPGLNVAKFVKQRHSPNPPTSKNSRAWTESPRTCSMRASDTMGMARIV